ncbi:MAG: HEPN domain-containing protein [Chloroflexi bacterium]|nr:HEPN domain-containing protein [Chloroflexota bacterium]
MRLAQHGKGEGILLEDLCFEAQQTAAKALKALLIHLDGNFPKVHSIALLLERLEKHAPVPDPIKEAVDLTDYAVQFRYRGHYAPVTEEEYERAILLASKVLDWVKNRIKTA